MRQLRPWASNAVVLETSCGALIVDLFTDDAPDISDYFLTLVLGQCLTGAMATSSHYGGALLRFAVPCQGGGAAAVGSELAPWLDSDDVRARNTRHQRFGISLRTSRDAANAGAGAVRAASSQRLKFVSARGLLLVEASRRDREREVTQLKGRMRTGGPSVFYVVMTDQNLDFLEEQFIAFGAVVEGHAALTRMVTHVGHGVRSRSDDDVAEVTQPLRLIRVKRATVLCRDSVPAGLVAAAGCANRAMGEALLAEPSPFLRVERDGGGDAGGRFQFHCAEDFRGEFLSSDDDDDGNGTQSSATAEKKRELNQRALDETRALMLHVMDGVTDTTITPPDTVLFVCKLNPVTTSDGLRACFSQFGEVRSSDVILDARGNSRCYAFVEFADRHSCDRAFAKMDKALIDDSRIHVDYSQSVSKVWLMESQRKKEARVRPRDA